MMNDETHSAPDTWREIDTFAIGIMAEDLACHLESGLVLDNPTRTRLMEALNAQDQAETKED